MSRFSRWCKLRYEIPPFFPYSHFIYTHIQLEYPNHAKSTTNGQESVIDKLIFQFQCCGYLNSTSPAFVTDSVCPSPAAATLLRGCSTSMSSFANAFINDLFTAVFGMVGTSKTSPSSNFPLFFMQFKLTYI